MPFPKYGYSPENIKKFLNQVRPFSNPTNIFQYFFNRAAMFETSGSYVLVKRFRRDYAENISTVTKEPKEKVSSVKIQSSLRAEKPKKEIKKETTKKQDVQPRDKRVSDAPLRTRWIYWLKTILYYITFYAGLAILFCICFSIYELTLPEDGPRVLRLQPSLVYYPNYESYYVNRISWNAYKEKDVKLIVNNINSFLEKLGTRREFGKCRANNSYGYTSRNPCVFLKVNRIAGFQVDPIENVEDLKRKERVLKKVIYSLPLDKRKGRLWISCKSNSWVNIEYFPQSRSIPIEQINTKQSNYDSKQNGSSYSESVYERIITIQIQNVPPSKLINVNCNMFAKNIESDNNRRPWVGGVSFDLILLTNWD